MRADPPADILLKTEKITLVLEGTGDGKVRCSASAWEDAKTILADQVLEIRALGKQLWLLRKPRAPEPAEERPLG
jgi:hypothetical protein